MNQFIKKNFSKIISLFLIMQPILDLLTGIGIHSFNNNLTIGIIFRIIFLLFICLSLIFIYKKKKVLYIYSIFLIYSILYIIGVHNYGGIFYELQGLFKMLYFEIILISLYFIKDELKIDKKDLLIVLSSYLLLIFIPTIFGIGYKSYEITKAGKLGFFNSANEIGGIISILTPILLVYIINLKKHFYIIPLTIIYFIVILTMGTKTPLIALLMTIFMGLIYLWIKLFKNKLYKYIVLSLLVLIVAITSLIIIIPKTNFYKNIETHLNFLKVDDVRDIFNDEELIDHFIFSQRLTFLSYKKEIYSNSKVYNKLFGIGYYHNDEVDKYIEMDYFDIYYNHGVIGFILSITIILYFIYKIFIYKQKLIFERYMLYTSLLLILILSFFTGHIILAPSVSLISISIIILLLKGNEIY